VFLKNNKLLRFWDIIDPLSLSTLAAVV